jgi:hypothetical protein
VVNILVDSWFDKGKSRMTRTLFIDTKILQSVQRLLATDIPAGFEIFVIETCTSLEDDKLLLHHHQHQ